MHRIESSATGQGVCSFKGMLELTTTPEAGGTIEQPDGF